MLRVRLLNKEIFNIYFLYLRCRIPPPIIETEIIIWSNPGALTACPLPALPDNKGASNILLAKAKELCKNIFLIRSMCRWKWRFTSTFELSTQIRKNLFIFTLVCRFTKFQKARLNRANKWTSNTFFKMNCL